MQLLLVFLVRLFREVLLGSLLVVVLLLLLVHAVLVFLLLLLLLLLQLLLGLKFANDVFSQQLLCLGLLLQSCSVDKPTCPAAFSSRAPSHLLLLPLLLHALQVSLLSQLLRQLEVCSAGDKEAVAALKGPRTRCAAAPSPQCQWPVLPL